MNRQEIIDATEAMLKEGLALLDVITDTEVEQWEKPLTVSSGAPEEASADTRRMVNGAVADPTGTTAVHPTRLALRSARKAAINEIDASRRRLSGVRATLEAAHLEWAGG